MPEPLWSNDAAAAQSSAHLAYVAHHIPGRARIRVPAARRNPELLRRVAEAAGKISQTKAVDTNPVTGSVLVHYEHPAFAQFLQLLAEAFEGILVMVDPEAEIEEGAVELLLAGPSQTAKVVADSFRALDREMKMATGNVVDLRLLVPLAAIAVSATLITESVATPLWLTLAIFSMNSFLQLNPT